MKTRINFLKKFIYKIKPIFSDHIFKVRYSSYDDYINHQKLKTTDPIRRTKWLNEEWRLKLNYFHNEFKYLIDSKGLNLGNKGLGLGARTGQEVQAMVDVGIKDSIGVDLVEHLPLVIEGDIHNLPFDDNSFSFVYSNIYDHALYPEKFISEAARVLQKNGIFDLHLQVGIVTDEFGVVDITSTKTVIKNMKKNGLDILFEEDIKDQSIGMTTRLVFQRKQ